MHRGNPSKGQTLSTDVMGIGTGALIRLGRTRCWSSPREAMSKGFASIERPLAEPSPSGHNSTRPDPPTP